MSTALHASLAQHLNGVVHLPETGVIRVVGAEAAQFLHGQLTQDILLMGQHEARLAAFCSAKGRMLASFMVFKRGTEEVLLTCSRDILPQTVKRLSMFVLRAQVRLSDASDGLAVHGLVGDAVPPALATAATIFMGQVEGPIFIRAYLDRLSRSELFMLISVGMACVSGSTMVAYATILKGCFRTPRPTS